MSEQPQQPAPGARNIPSLLTDLRVQKRNCTVVVSGSPGGTIHVRDGLVVAVETPGSPTVEGLLLKSGRITEQDWVSVCAAEPDRERLGDALVAQGLVGRVELEVLCVGAVFDAAFALSLTVPEEWRTADPVPVLHLGEGVPPERLVPETSRRIALLAEEPGSVARFARTRVRAATGAGDPGAARTQPARHQDVLAHTDGRRTPRDMAFALGRGLYPVMLDLRHLEDLGLVQRQDPPSRPARPSTAPRSVPSAAASAAPGDLPRRLPGRNLPEPARGATDAPA